jgi:DNA-binding NtrC family response regulator
MPRLLVVDDDPHIREILIQRLRRRGYEVEGAANGDIAIDRLAMADYEVVILDLMMGAVGGNEVFLAMQSLPRKPRVIIVSALAELWRRHHNEKDAFAVFAKPVEFDTLASAIDRALR